jgi:RNA polymerase sigma-70 factor (ECF subfamily)
MHREFEQAISNNVGRIRYIASRYSHHDELDDMYQDILLQLWRSFDSFKGDSAIETWIYKVALNTAMTFVRKSVKRKALNQSISAIFATEHQPGHENCQADILNQFMNTLNDTDSTILMMYLDGLSATDTSDVIGISSNAISVRIKRIKTAFETQYIGE